MAGNEIFNDLNLVLQLNQHIQAATTNGARVASPSGSLTKQSSFQVLTNLESVGYSEAREDAQFDHQRSVFLSLNASDLPFHLQGDRDFNEAGAMAKRRGLRFSELIKNRIEFLWEVAGGKKQAEMAQRIRQQKQEEDETGGRSRRTQQSVRRTTAANGIKELLPPLVELDEEDYMALLLLIFKVLRDDFVLELAHKQIQCDWEVDSHHGMTLSFDQFFAAIFELVDVWTCDMEEATYERFLHLLARRITRRVAVFLDGAELKLSLSDNFEPEVVVKSIPMRTIPKFMSVASFLTGRGMKTVGELAQADPKVVERERLSFIQRNNGGAVPDSLNEMRKISQDLQTLIAMFKSIALQFENMNYTLENNVLRRLPTAGSARPQPGGSKREVGESTAGISLAGEEKHRINQEGGVYGEIGSNGDTRSVATISAGNNSPGGGGGNHQNASSKSDAETRQAQTTTGGMTMSGSMPENYKPGVDTNGSGSNATTHSFDNTRPTQRNTVTDSKSIHPQTNIGTRGASGGHLQPINTIHDLQLADASLLNALRSTFLIEKAISIERLTELPAIRNELVKFGVGIDATRLPEGAARDRYNNLYDLLVLRDGESLKTLAGLMLEQIKLELSAHGIFVVDEEDVEEVYDGFYASVVMGTGDSIVQEAQRWMDNTVQDNKVNDYIQHDFHELKSIDEVQLVGTKGGDEEFLALLPNDVDVKDNAVEVCDKPVGRKNSSPIQRKLSRTIPVPIPPVDTPKKTQPMALGPVEESLPRLSSDQVAAPVKDEADHSTDEKKRKAKKTKKKRETNEKTVSTPASPPRVQTPPPPEESHSSNRSLGEKTIAPKEKAIAPKEKAISTSRKPKLTISTQASVNENVSEIIKSTEESPSLGPPIEATKASTPDDTQCSRPTLNSHHARPPGLEIDTALDEKSYHDSFDQHAARDALNVAIEFEEDNAAAEIAGSKNDGERPITMEPKVPKIVVGGSSSAKNAPVTGRYIQLLGLGTVLITKAERDLFQLLCSPEGLDTDLVCFDIGAELDSAVAKLQAIQRSVGNRVILFGGNTDEPEKTQLIALECLAHGALYFATIPFDFPRLRERIMAYFENSKQPFILRQRKPPGQTAQVGSSIGAGSLFALHDEPRRVSTSVAFAKTPRRKIPVAIPSLPSLLHSPQSIPPVSSDPRRADFTPIAPSTPRSSQSRNRSPRFSTTMNKLIR